MPLQAIFGLGRADAPILVTGPLTLRPPRLADFAPWRDLREASRAHLTEWEQDWRADEATREAFARRLGRSRRQQRAGRGLSLFVFDSEATRLVGGASLSDIRAEPFSSAVLGYWIGEPYCRRGYGAAAAAAIVRHGFGAYPMNRISAACQPGNIASQRLLAGLGFAREGVACDYLTINGEPRDHEIHAITRDRFARANGG